MYIFRISKPDQPMSTVLYDVWVHVLRSRLQLAENSGDSSRQDPTNTERQDPTRSEKTPQDQHKSSGIPVKTTVVLFILRTK
jgi:hypothetical protein